MIGFTIPVVPSEGFFLVLSISIDSIGVGFTTPALPSQSSFTFLGCFGVGSAFLKSDKSIESDLADEFSKADKSIFTSSAINYFFKCPALIAASIICCLLNPGFFFIADCIIFSSASEYFFTPLPSSVAVPISNIPVAVCNKLV